MKEEEVKKPEVKQTGNLKTPHPWKGHPDGELEEMMGE
jgi:hypothetical protein